MSEIAASNDTTEMTVGFQPEGISPMRWSPPTDDPRQIRRDHYWSTLNPDPVPAGGINHVEYLYESAAPTSNTYTTCPNDRAYAWPVLLVCVAACEAASRSVPPIPLPKHSAVEFAERAADATDLMLGFLDDWVDRVTPTGDLVVWAAANWSLYSWLGPTAVRVRQALVELQRLAGTNASLAPAVTRIRARAVTTFAAAAAKLPPPGEGGAQNRAIVPCIWLEWVGAELAPSAVFEQKFRHHIEGVWAAFRRPDVHPPPAPHTAVPDIEDDATNYSVAVDLPALEIWGGLRKDWSWDAPGSLRLWRHYCDMIGNDGTLPGYGDSDGMFFGNWFQAVRMAEFTARHTREPRYKWLARRAFWAGRDRLWSIELNRGFTEASELALAYLIADDTVAEQAPAAGLTVTTRRNRTWDPLSSPSPDKGWFITDGAEQPSKVMLRSGPAETDHWLLMQAGNLAGHGHVDSSDILMYAGDWSYFLCYGGARLDYCDERRNVLVMADPKQITCWMQTRHFDKTKKIYTYDPAYTSEQTSIRASGHQVDAAAAQLVVTAHPSADRTLAAWQRARPITDDSGVKAHTAMGYRDWPVTLTRTVLLVYNRFALVRDDVVVDGFSDLPDQSVAFTAGQNWTILPPLASGPGWVDVHIPIVHGGYFNTRPVELAGQPLLILQVGPPGARQTVVPGPATNGSETENLPYRVWAPITGLWPKRHVLSFATLLLPHDKASTPATVASQIQVHHHDQNGTEMSVHAGSTQYQVAINGTQRGPIHAGFITSDGLALLNSGLPNGGQRITALQATTVTANTPQGPHDLLKVTDPTDFSTTLPE